jgi:hypothetical protein
MTHDKFESKLLKQINSIDQIDEGLGSTILNLLFGGKFKKTLQSISREEDDFPEYQAALADLNTHLQNLEKIQARMNKQVKALNKANKRK